MKKLMILGAGIYQVPLILQAKSMGLYTIAVSCAGDYPGFALADRCYTIDTTDRDAVLKAAAAEQISGICTSGTDVAISTLGYVCDRLNLCGPSAAAAGRATNKYEMKQAFLRAGVSTPASYRASSLEEAYACAERIGYPLMTKAVDSSGSRGVIKVTSPESLPSAVEASLSVSRQPYILVEQFIDGHEIGVDGFWLDGELPLFLPHEKYVCFRKGTGIPAGHRFPWNGPSDTLAALKMEIERALRALGVDHCAFNSDVLIAEGRPWILELGARAGATCIPELASLYCGYSYYEQIIRCALGESPAFPEPDKTPCMARLLFSSRDGIVTSIDETIIRRLRGDGVLVSLDVHKGDRVFVPQNGTHRIGQVILLGNDEPALAQAAERACSAISVDGHSLGKEMHAASTAGRDA